MSIDIPVMDVRAFKELFQRNVYQMCKILWR
jgi:hypothetical protein